MNKRSSATTKTRYFRKDYAPARLAKTQKKSSRQRSTASSQLSQSIATDLGLKQKTSAKVSAGLKQAARKTGQAAKKTAQSVQNTVRKITQSSAKSAPAARSRSTARRKTTTKRKREPITWREIALISQLGTSAFVIIFALIFCAVNDPVKRTQQELEKLADAYYIEYLYPSSLGSKLYQPETVLADYAQAGLPAVKLRQLLLYNNGKYSSSLSVFSNAYYKCDTNQTYVRYYPVEPYGPRDYTVTYGPVCEKVSSVN